MGTHQPDGPGGAFPDRIPPIRWLRWPVEGEPRYCLGFGILERDYQIPTWGLVTVEDGSGSPVAWKPRPREVTVAALREWLEPLTSAEAAKGMAAAFSASHPELFTQTE